MQKEVKENFAFRANKQLAEEIDNYREELELTRSDALRDLVRQGLRAEEIEERVEELSERVEEMEEERSKRGLRKLF